jgi:hypothetical protein
MSQAFEYDPATDSLYIKVRLGESADNRIIGEDGEPVGSALPRDRLGHDTDIPRRLRQKPRRR